MKNNIMSNMIRTIIQKSELKIGMTVEVDGELFTVSKNDLSSGFLGYSFRGAAYPRKITMVQFAVPTANGIVLR